MQTHIDLDKLSKDQLKALIHARGHVIRMFIGADNGFSTKVQSMTLSAKDIEQMMTFKQNILAEMAVTEQAIIEGRNNNTMN